MADHFFHVRRVDTAAAWKATPTPEACVRHRDDDAVARILARAGGGKHVDCHCTVWTSRHFASVVPEAIRLCALPLRIRSLEEPRPGTNEFIVHLERT